MTTEENPKKSYCAKWQHDSILDKFVVHPNSNFYLMFVSYMSVVSLISTFTYTYVVVFGCDDRAIVPLIIFTELSYFCSLLIESLKAYDDEGDGTFEMRWQKTTKKYWSTFDFKMSFVNIVPIGLLGQVQKVEWMRVLWVLKIYRVVYFLRIFEYQNYNRFIRGMFAVIFYAHKKNQQGDKNQLRLGQESMRSEVDCIKQQELIFMQHVFKILGQIMQMMILCWILGMLYLYAIVFVEPGRQETHESCGDENFLSFDFKDGDTCIGQKNIFDQLLILFYFMTTTMSTVGLGDFRPTNSFERCIIIVYLLVGFLFFSYILNETQAMKEELSVSMKDFHDINGLNKFLETLRRKYNHGMP